MREIRLHDTLANAVRALEPRDGRRVGIYACGPTVYGRLHVGNARPFVVFALLKRFLQHEGYEVTLVENITDVNDKIYREARKRGVSSSQLAKEMSDLYLADSGRLGLGRPDYEPKASETIEAIIALIQALLDAGHAYVADGDVYFRVGSFAEYGRLSNRSLSDMDQGEDAGTDALKESPHDFALWKAHKPDEDTAWQAPWGSGRPGWHIECSAMAEQILGVGFDIHGGGTDLIFPHHENELAQTQAARGEPLARIWMHNGLVRFAEEKMSKSVGNIWSLHEALDQVGREALVMYFVSGTYREPLEFSPDALESASRSVDRLRDFVRRLDFNQAPSDAGSEFAARFFDALADDFNTPAARAVLFDWVAEGNRRMDSGQRVGSGPTLEMLWTLGLESIAAAGTEEADPHAERLLAQREQARARRDFETADRKRTELADLGWEVRDTPQGPQLVPKRKSPG